MKTIPLSDNDVDLILGLHAMRLRDVPRAKLREGITLFTGARIVEFSLGYFLVCYKPRFTDALNLYLFTREEIFDRLRSFEVDTLAVSLTQQEREEYDSRTTEKRNDEFDLIRQKYTQKHEDV